MEKKNAIETLETRLETKTLELSESQGKFQELQQKSAEQDEALERLEQEKIDLSTVNGELTVTIESMKAQLAAQELAADGQYADGASDASDSSSSTAAAQALQQRLLDLQREEENLKSLQEDLQQVVQRKDDVQSQVAQLQSTVQDQTRQMLGREGNSRFKGNLWHHAMS